MRFQFLAYLASAAFILSSCGGSQPQALRSDASRTDDNPQTAPLVDILFNDFNPETTDLRFSEGQAIEFKIDSITTGVETMSLAQTSGPSINFGTMSAGGQETEGDLNVATSNSPIVFTLSDSEGTRRASIDQIDRLTVKFRAPSVTERTVMNFRFESQSASSSRSRTIAIVIEDDGEPMVLNGTVSKGLVKNTNIRLFSVDRLTIIFNGNREIIEPVQISDEGEYNFEVLPATDLEELLRFEVKGEGADMVCDAPQGCNEYAFGETFEVEDDLDLRALIEVPRFGSTTTANVNIFTTLAAKRAGQLNGLRRVSPGNLRDGQEDVASVFGIRNQDFSTVPFIDVTQPFFSFDEDAVRLAIMSGGILGATFLHSDPDDDEDYLEELDDFIDEFGDREINCRDSAQQTTLSVEDIMAQAVEIARLIEDPFNEEYFSRRVADIRNGSFTCDFVTPPNPE